LPIRLPGLKTSTMEDTHNQSMALEMLHIFDGVDPKVVLVEMDDLAHGLNDVAECTQVALLCKAI